MKLSAFGLCVRGLRLQLGLTLREMAVALSVSSPYLSSIELGERTLTAKIADEAIQFFEKKGVSVKQLAELREACHHSLEAVPVSALDAERRDLVAAFARRLSGGSGIPDEVRNYIKGDDKDGANRK